MKEMGPFLIDRGGGACLTPRSLTSFANDRMRDWDGYDAKEWLYCCLFLRAKGSVWSFGKRRRVDKPHKCCKTKLPPFSDKTG
jgi:hypothetical protein